MRLSDAFDQYKRDVIVFSGQSHKTEENHDIAKRAFITFAGDIDCASLSFELVRDWKVSLDKNRSPVTVRCYIIKLRVVLTYLYKRGLTSLDPDLIPVPKRVHKVPQYLSAAQVAQCVNATKRVKNKAIVSLLYSFGLRVSELCALDRGQIKEDYSFTIVGKGGKDRLCFTDERTVKLLDTYLKTRKDNNPALFLTDAGHRITPGVIQETFKSIRKQTGFACHPHTMRHSFATNLLKSNTNLFHIAKMMGHSSTDTTKVYLHAVDEDLRQVYTQHHTI